MHVYIQKFKSSALLAHEREVNQLQQKGSSLIDSKHPGSATIKVNRFNQKTPLNLNRINGTLVFLQAHSDTVQAEWQAFLNLCLAQEVHLDNIDDYRKVELSHCDDCVSAYSLVTLAFCSLQFQLDADTLSESLEKLNSTLDPKSLTNRSNPETLLALEVRHCFQNCSMESLEMCKRFSSKNVETQIVYQLSSFVALCGPDTEGFSLISQLLSLLTGFA